MDNISMCGKIESHSCLTKKSFELIVKGSKAKPIDPITIQTMGETFALPTTWARKHK
jgi:hypothetical protein